MPVHTVCILADVTGETLELTARVPDDNDGRVWSLYARGGNPENGGSVMFFVSTEDLWRFTETAQSMMELARFVGESA